MHVDVSRDLDRLRELSDDDLVAGLGELDQAACQVGAAIVAHLIVIKERSIHVARGYSSIVDYCVQWLGCSRDVAYKRSAAVKVAEAHPTVIDSMAAGEMSMSALAVLAPYRDDAELIRMAMGRSRRQVQKLVAARHPDTDWNRVQRVRPVTEGRSALELTVPDALVELIEHALDLDSHIDPSRNMAALLERAVGAYVKQRERARFAIADRPRTPSDVGTKTVPAATLRQAYERFGGHCEYVAEDGTRCTCRVFLEADHVVMRALGGDHDRIRILCRNHNQFEAETKLGVDVMDRARRSAALAREVQAALRGLGFSAADARPAARAAIDRLGPEAELEAVLKQALRHVARPRGYTASALPSRAREPTSRWPDRVPNAAPRPHGRVQTGPPLRRAGALPERAPTRASTATAAARTYRSTPSW
jgi:hypothetical protein